MNAFEDIYTVYREDVYRFLCKLTNYNDSLAEELLSETFFQVFVSLKRFKGACEIKTWLCQIAKNTYSGYVRKEIRREHLYQKLTGDAITGDFSKQAEDRELLLRIQEILKECNQRARDIVWYRMYAELKFQEISKILNIKETTAKVIFYRTKVYIQNELKERFGYEI